MCLAVSPVLGTCRYASLWPYALYRYNFDIDPVKGKVGQGKESRSNFYYYYYSGTPT